MLFDAISKLRYIPNPREYRFMCSAAEGEAAAMRAERWSILTSAMNITRSLMLDPDLGFAQFEQLVIELADLEAALITLKAEYWSAPEPR